MKKTGTIIFTLLFATTITAVALPIINKKTDGKISSAFDKWLNGSPSTSPAEKDKRSNLVTIDLSGNETSGFISYSQLVELMNERIGYDFFFEDLPVSDDLLYYTQTNGIVFDVADDSSNEYGIPMHMFVINDDKYAYNRIKITGRRASSNGDPFLIAAASVGALMEDKLDYEEVMKVVDTQREFLTESSVVFSEDFSFITTDQFLISKIELWIEPIESFKYLQWSTDFESRSNSFPYTENGLVDENDYTTTLFWNNTGLDDAPGVSTLNDCDLVYYARGKGIRVAPNGFFDVQNVKNFNRVKVTFSTDREGASFSACNNASQTHISTTPMEVVFEKDEINKNFLFACDQFSAGSVYIHKLEFWVEESYPEGFWDSIIHQ